MKMSTMFDWKKCFRSFSRRDNYKQSDVDVLSPSICDMTWQSQKTVNNQTENFCFLSSFYIALILIHYVTTFLPLPAAFEFSYRVNKLSLIFSLFSSLFLQRQTILKVYCSVHTYFIDWNITRVHWPTSTMRSQPNRSPTRWVEPQIE